MKGSKKRFWLLTIVSVMLLSVALAGCGAKSGGSESTGGSEKKSDLKMGLVTDLGSVNDKSFNQSAWEALQQLNKDTGVEVKYVEPKKDTDLIPNLKEFVNAKYDMIWATGMTMGDPLTKVAPESPNAKFGIVDVEVQAPNVASVLFKEHEGSFLVGVIAGKMTKTNKIGFVGGMQIPVIQKFEAGFRAGVAAVNPEAAKKENFYVNYVGDFVSVDKGKTAASSLFNAGADIIFHASGQVGNGVFQEGIEQKKAGKDVWVIGVDKDQSLTFGDDITLTSMIKKVDEAVIQVSKQMIDGKFPGGTTTILGLKEKGVGIADTSSKNVPADVLKLVEEYSAKIVSGEITVPEAPAAE